MKTSVLYFSLLFLCFFTQAFSQADSVKTVSPKANLTLYGRGIYPGDDSTYELMKTSGFNTVVLSSFYIKSNGDVFSGDDGKQPIIHNGKYVGNKDWLKHVASLKKNNTSVTRTEILLEGRWFNQPPNTYDFIRDWANATAPSSDANVTVGTGKNSTLYQIAKVMKDEIGVDAVCIDDESVYDSKSIVAFGKMVETLNLHMTLCPYTNKKYWKEIVDQSNPGLIDAIYLQCYDGGARAKPAPWHDSVSQTIPVYPIFLCRGAFDKCNTDHNSKTPDEIKTEMIRFKKEYPGMSGGAIWQIADVKNYIRMNCAKTDLSSGSATSAAEFLSQLKNSLQEGLQNQ